jgi:predicted nucleic acid-binding protein
MIIVLDASAALEIVMNRKWSLEFKEDLLGCEKVIAPSLYQAEVASALSMHVKNDDISLSQAQVLLSDATELIDGFHSIEGESVQALSESVRLNHSIYDMYYLMFSRKYGAHLLTMDKRLKTLAHKDGLNYIHYEEVDFQSD